MKISVEEIKNGFLVYDDVTCKKTYKKTFEEAQKEVVRRWKEQRGDC